MEFDLNVLSTFYDEIYAPSLQLEGQAFLMALAARDKYCLPGEDYVMCNRTEMLAREYAEYDDFEVFVAKLHRLVGNDYSYLDKYKKTYSRTSESSLCCSKPCGPNVSILPLYKEACRSK